MLAYYGQVGPDYYAMGAPLLHISRLRYGMEWEQQLLKGRIQASVYMKRDDDPFQPFQLFRQSLESNGMRVRFQQAGLPFLSLDYAPYVFRPSETADSLTRSFGLSMLSIQSGHSYRLGKASFSTFLQYSRQSGKRGEAGGGLLTHMINLTQSVALGIPVSLNASGSYLLSESDTSHQEMLWMDLSVQAVVKNWTFSGGWQYAHNGQGSGPVRKGGYAVLKLPLFKKLSMDIRIEQNVYQQYFSLPPGSREWRVRGGIQFNW